MVTEPLHAEKQMSEVYQGASPNARLLAGSIAASENNTRRYGNAFSVSLASHVAILLLVLFVITLPVIPTPDSQTNLSLKDIIWTAQPGPGGGGGGGGNKMPEPPRKAELPDKNKITVPVAKPPKMQAPEEPKPEQQLNVPAQPIASGIEQLPGAVTSMISPTLSQGSGTNGGAGTGKGTGSGPGDGSGLGPGYGGGFGGGAYRPGNGVTQPRLIREFKPNYTADAMRAKIQGIVMLEAVVMTDGSVGQVRVTRSLDPTFGLDQEAERTVKKWLFAPGTRLGQAVPVLIEIEMSFTLR
jgi:periplasmic protein TonB